jgi:hypothetical protein
MGDTFLFGKGQDFAGNGDFCEHPQRKWQLLGQRPLRLLHSSAKFCHFARPILRSQLLGKALFRRVQARPGSNGRKR